MNSQEVRNALDNSFFEERTTFNEETQCAEWNGLKNKNGYGHVHIRGIDPDGKRMFKAHRISYLFYIGDIEEGNVIMHKCNNNACCNPEHLYQGTNAERIQKMEENGNASYHYENNPQYGNNNRGKKILAGGIVFDSYVEAGKYFDVSDNAIRKRIKTQKEGYRILD